MRFFRRIAIALHRNVNHTARAGTKLLKGLNFK